MAGRDTAGTMQDGIAAWRKRSLVIWSLIGVAGLLYIAGIAINVLAIPLGIVIWTVIIVFVLRGPLEALVTRGMSRMAATVICYIVLIAVLGLIGGFMFSPVFSVGDQFSNLILGAPTFVEQASAWINDTYARFADIAESATVTAMIDSFQSSATEFVRNMASGLTAGLLDAGSTMVSILICLGFGLVVSFWLLLEMPGIEGDVNRMSVGKHAEDLHFFHVTMSRAVGGYIRATLLQCGVIAIAAILGFSILRVPNAVAFALIVGMVNVVPVVGQWIAGIFVALSLVFSNPFLALIAFAYLMVIQRVVYTFISPKLMADSVDVHPALVIIAMMIGYAVGIQVGGVLGAVVGMLLAVPSAAIAKSSFVYYFEKRTGRRLVSEKSVLFKGVPAADGTVNPAHDAVSPQPRRPSVRDKQARMVQRRTKRASQKQKRD